MKNARIDLRIPEDQKDFWERGAKALGLNLSELIRQAVDKELASRLAQAVV